MLKQPKNLYTGGLPHGTTHQMTTSPTMNNEEILRYEIEVFRAEHRDLDDAISALQDATRADLLSLKRLKKQKLALKDKIRQMEDRLNPDIIA